MKEQGQKIGVGLHKSELTNYNLSNTNTETNTEICRHKSQVTIFSRGRQGQKCGVH